MDPTTLVTFLFQAPPHMRTVELFGSWDNFTHAYRMHQDRRRGPGFWAGTFKFEDIIFDGETLQRQHPRTGGLKQGGTYWYYYVLNEYLERCDTLYPLTRECPLRPGQVMNVMEVPMEVARAPSRCRSAYGDVLGTLTTIPEKHTLDPASKYVPVSPPPVSRVHTWCQSDEALHGRLENRPASDRSVRSKTAPPPPPLPPRQYIPSPCDADAVSLLSEDSCEMSPSRAQSSVSSISLYSCTPDTEESIHQPDAVSEQISLIEEEDVDYDDDEEVDALPVFVYPDTLGPTPLETRKPASGLLRSVSAREPARAWSPGGSKSAAPSRISFRRTLSDRVRNPTTRSISSPDMSQSADAAAAALQRVSSPRSVQNVQFYGSRPCSATTADETPANFRPRMYSLPNLEIGDAATAPPPPPIQTTPRYLLETCRRSLSLNGGGGGGPQSASTSTCFSPAASLTPTFSAATVSTDDGNGGANTPHHHRLSYFCLPAPAGVSRDDEKRGSLSSPDSERVAVRLLSTFNDGPERKPSLTAQMPYAMLARRGSTPHGLVSYALPSVALMKDVVGVTAPQHPALRPCVDSMSLATLDVDDGDLFAELEYLVGSIL